MPPGRAHAVAAAQTDQYYELAKFREDVKYWEEVYNYCGYVHERKHK
eukprot:COSAG04_NODE_1328_length_7204_cov_249.095303_4_plen_47_part_00